jgi:hypothetical protein
MERLLKKIFRESSISDELDEVLAEFALIRREPLLHACGRSLRLRAQNLSAAVVSQ